MQRLLFDRMVSSMAVKRAVLILKQKMIKNSLYKSNKLCYNE